MARQTAEEIAKQYDVLQTHVVEDGDLEETLKEMLCAQEEVGNPEPCPG
jgi:hypothetical protein